MSEYLTNLAHRERLTKVHEARHREHWGPNYDVARQPWPKTDAEWRQTPHGAPWDANVTMAEWHLKFAARLVREGLVQS